MPRLQALTSLRFIAALHVVVYHLQAFGEWPVPSVARGILDTGYVAVSFFFVLSGFILTWTHASKPPRSRLGHYAMQRFARIYPVYFVALLLTLPGWLHSRGDDGFVVKTLAVPVLLQAWVPPWAMAWNPPAWSLSVEACFYAAFPFVLPLVLKARVRTLWVVAGLAWLAGLLLAVAYVVLQPDGALTIDHHTQAFWLNALKFHPLVRMPEFLVGMALARSLQNRETRPELGAFGLGAAVLTIGVLVASPQIPYALLHNGLLTPLFTLIIAWAATARPDVPLLSNNVLVTLGEASYSLYILQTAAMALSHGVLKRVAPGVVATPLAFGLITTVVCVVGSVLAWMVVEKPVRNWLVARFHPERRGAAP